VGNPAEETYCHPNTKKVGLSKGFVNLLLGCKESRSQSGFFAATRSALDASECQKPFERFAPN
jgi:hypothetical protein